MKQLPARTRRSVPLSHFAACEEKGPVEKAADEVEDVIDEAN
jgi:hypothetical protein